MNVFLNAGIMATLAALVTITATVVIEKFGGVIGGVVGSYPATLILASVGILINLLEKYDLGAPGDYDLAHHDFEVAMFSFPIAIVSTTLLVVMWQQLPPRLPIRNHVVKGFTLLGISIVFWLSASVGLVFLLPFLDSHGLDRKITGVIATVVYTLIAYIVSFTRYFPSPAGKKKVPKYILGLRGVVAGLAIFVGVVLARYGGPTVGGVASVFPAVFLTTMTSLWLSQGEQVVIGATSSLMLGFVATPIYSFSASFLCFSPVGLVGGVILASLAAMVYSVGLGIFLKWWQRRQEARYHPVKDQEEGLDGKEDPDSVQLRSSLGVREESEEDGERLEAL